MIQLSVKFDENDRVEDIAFVNSGCTISTASASMMTDAVMGKQKRKLKNWHRSFQKWSKANQIPRQEELGDAAFLSGVSKFPQRIKCATLSWNALKKRSNVANS